MHNTTYFNPKQCELNIPIEGKQKDRTDDVQFPLNEIKKDLSFFLEETQKKILETREVESFLREMEASYSLMWSFVLFFRLRRYRTFLTPASDLPSLTAISLLDNPSAS